MRRGGVVVQLFVREVSAEGEMSTWIDLDGRAEQCYVL